jgi:predicted transcriptional regulator
MKEGLITEQEAQVRLRSLCDEAGGVGELAKLLGITPGAVSHQLHGTRPIQGRVAEYMGLKIQRETTIHYREADQK